MMLVLSTFVATTLVYVALLGLALRRVTRHLQGNVEAVRAVTEHVLVPLLGRTKDEPEKKKPMPRDARLC